MNKESLKFYILFFLFILTMITGVFLVVCAIFNPTKFIIGKLTEEDFLNKEKYIKSTRYLCLVVGFIVILFSLLWLFKKIDNSDTIISYVLSSLILRFGDSFISKKYLNKKQAK